jgi:hypothetical protein
MISPCRIVTSPKDRLSMMRHFSFLFITALCINVFAVPEIDYLSEMDKQVVSYTKSATVILTNSRQMILDAVRANDTGKIRELTVYLKNKFSGQKIVLFYPSEDFFLHFWLSDYTLISNTAIIDSLIEMDFFGFQMPLDDNLFNDLRLESSKAASALERSIDASREPQEVRDWLRLFLHFLAYNPRNDTLQNYSSINAEAESFLSKYPNSLRVPFICKRICFRYKISDWGLGYGFFSGGGYYLGRLGTCFNSTVAMGLSLDLYYKRAVLFLRYLIGVGGSTTKNFYYAGSWIKGRPLNEYVPEIALGAFVLQTKHLSLIPEAGLGVASISLPPTSKDTTKGAGEIPFKMTMSVGLNIDLKFPRSGNFVPNIPYYKTGAWLLRLRFGYYRPSFGELNSMFEGGQFYFNIGIGGFSRQIIKCKGLNND